MIDITINSNKFFINDTLFTVLQQCEILNITIPRFCYHEKLSIAGNCRICLVEVNNSFKLVIACSTMISKNIIINTISNTVKNSRENIIEFLLINHPLDCPICDQGGECDLQDQTLLFGKDRARFTEIRRTVLDKFISPFIKTIMTRCIHCTRCIRYFNEVVGYNLLGTLGRGNKTEIGNYILTNDISELSGNVVDLCPVGALTSKPFAFTTRPWELTHIESIDLLDSYCSIIRVNLKADKIMRILPSIVNERNTYWITNKIRFSYDSIVIQRIYNPKIKILHTHNFIDVSWKKLFKYLKLNLNTFLTSLNALNYSYAYTGKFIDVNTLLIFKYFINNLDLINLNIHSHLNNDFMNNYLLNTSDLIPTAETTFFLFYGVNTKIENSIVNLKIRKLIIENENEIFIYYIGNKIDLNYTNIHLGLSMLTIMEIYYGAVFICYDIIKSTILNFISGIGASNDDFNILDVLTNLSNNISKKINYKYNNLFSSDVAILDLNITSKIYSKLYDKKQFTPKFLYLFGYDDFYNLNLKTENLFLIYHGHHFTNVCKKAMILIPTATFLERNSYYMDCDGLIHHSNSITGLDSKFFDDAKFFISFIKYFNLETKVNRIIFLNNILKYKIPNYRNYNYNNSSLNLYFSTIIIHSNYVKYKFIEDAWIFYTGSNFYTMDIFSNNSIIVSNYLQFVRNLSNF